MTVFRCQDNCAERYDSSKQQKNHPLGKLTFFFLLSFDSYWEILKKTLHYKRAEGEIKKPAGDQKVLSHRNWAKKAKNK